MNTAYTITDKSIVLMIDGKTQIINRTDDRFSDVYDAIRDKNFESIPAILDIKGKLISDSCGGLYLLNGVLHCNDYKIEPLLASRIIRIYKERFDLVPITLFLENLMSNPSERSREQLYGFIEACNLPITADGHFLAYKMVTSVFKDIYTGTMDNSIGSIVEVPRENVDPDPNRTCSRGLHFCSEGYLGSYGTKSSSQVVIVKLNPRDVVSIPIDYNNAKGRACRYEVVDTISWDDKIKPLYTDEYSDNVLEDKSESNTNKRWELRRTSDGELIEAFTTRAESRVVRRINGYDDHYILDTDTQDVIAGTPYSDYLDDYEDDECVEEYNYADDADDPEYNEDNDEGYLGDDEYEEEYNCEDDYETYEDDDSDLRWVVYNIHDGGTIDSFYSRVDARALRKSLGYSDYYIWDRINNKIVV